MSFKQACGLVKLVIKPKGGVQETHCVIENGMLKATDGRLSVAHPVPTDASFVPRFKQLEEMAKMLRDDEEVSFTTDDRAKTLTAIVGPRRVSLVGADRSLITAGIADAEKYEVSEDFTEALALAAKILLAKGDSDATHAFNTGGVLFASDGRTAFEYYHASEAGEFTIPVDAVKAAGKVKSRVVSVGFSDISTTLHFENGAYVRALTDSVRKPRLTNIWSDFPPADRFFEPAGFIEECKTFAAMSPLGFAEIQGDEIRAFKDAGGSCSSLFDAEGRFTPEIATAYDVSVLAKMSKKITMIAFGQDTRRIYARDAQNFRMMTNPVAKLEPLLYIEPNVEHADSEE